MNKEQAKAFNKELNSAMETVFQKHNLKMVKTRLVYGDMIKHTVTLLPADGLSKEQIVYDRWAIKLGLPKRGTHVKWEAKGFISHDLILYGLRVGGPHKTVLFRDSLGKLVRLDYKRFNGNYTVVKEA